MSPITCEIAVRRASDQLVGLLPAADRIVLEEHLASCDRCSDLMDQLRTTIAVLRNRPGLDVPDVLRELVADTDDPRSVDLVRHLPQLYSLAVALDPATADDLVQETISRALADPPPAPAMPLWARRSLAWQASESRLGRARRRHRSATILMPTRRNSSTPTSTVTRPTPAAGSTPPSPGARHTCYNPSRSS